MGSGGAIAMIPARMGSTRFPGKALACDTGKPMVVHVCERAQLAESVSRVVVAAEDQEIVDKVREYGFEGVLTGEHPNGTSRLAEASKILGLKSKQIVVNVQGDEPEIGAEVIDGAIKAIDPRPLWDIGAAPGYLDEIWCGEFRGETTYGVGTVASLIESDDDFVNPNVVKVVTGMIAPDHGIARALYFSRAPIPVDRDGVGESDGVVRAPRLKHVGIYAYPVSLLDEYISMESTGLERSESLEQLRWLEHGCPVSVAIRDSKHVGIDTPEQYRAFVERCGE